MEVDHSNKEVPRVFLIRSQDSKETRTLTSENRKLEPQEQLIGSRATISKEDRDHPYLIARHVGRSIQEYAINWISPGSNATRRDTMRRNARWKLYVTDVENQGMWLETTRHMHQPIWWFRPLKHLQMQNPATSKDLQHDAEGSGQGCRRSSRYASSKLYACEVLIDSGATKSFISELFASKLNCPVEPLREF